MNFCLASTHSTTFSPVAQAKVIGQILPGMMERGLGNPFPEISAPQVFPELPSCAEPLATWSVHRGSCQPVGEMGWEDASVPQGLVLLSWESGSLL